MWSVECNFKYYLHIHDITINEYIIKFVILVYFSFFHDTSKYISYHMSKDNQSQDLIWKNDIQDKIRRLYWSLKDIRISKFCSYQWRVDEEISNDKSKRRYQENYMNLIWRTYSDRRRGGKNENEHKYVEKKKKTRNDRRQMGETRRITTRTRERIQQISEWYTWGSTYKWTKKKKKKKKRVSRRGRVHI